MYVYFCKYSSGGEGNTPESCVFIFASALLSVWKFLHSNNTINSTVYFDRNKSGDGSGFLKSI